MVRKLLMTIFMVTWVGLSSAGEAQPIAADPALESRVQALAEVLRCLVCQNQNLADSHADLAIDLKNQVREMLRQGQSEKEVIDYMVERYGDFVLYRPPVKSTTWFLWSGPFLLLGGGLIVLFVNLKRRRQRGDGALSESEHLEAAHLLNREAEGLK